MGSVTVFLKTLSIFSLLVHANSLCNRNVSFPFGLAYYQARVQPGEQKCTWTFYPQNNHEDFTLVIKVQDFEGRNYTDYVDWPDGTRWNGAEHSRPSRNNCVKYIKRNGKSNDCLKERSQDYCPGEATVLETWPPVMSSSAIGLPGITKTPYLYFEIFYIYLFCQPIEDTTTDSIIQTTVSSTTTQAKITTTGGYDQTDTLVASIVLAFALLISLIVIVILTFKMRAVMCKSDSGDVVAAGIGHTNICYKELDKPQSTEKNSA